MSEKKWVRSSLRQLSQRLSDLGHSVSPPTVGRLLRQLGYSLRVNVKKLEESAAHPEREKQFDLIEAQKQRFESANLPIISFDTKKKELIGNFKNAGQAWGQQPQYVNMHDFPQEALGKAVPYGIYDLTHNRGTVYVGSSADTPEFAVTVLARWWEEEGQVIYPKGQKISDTEMEHLNIEHAEVCAQWNYTLRPRVADPS